jgi:hypothetical protein
MRAHDVDGDFEHDRRRGRTPTGRVYVHARCGGATRVGGGDYKHICDPFWPCTGTYCCTCEGDFPLREVRWEDTGERVSDFRRRVRGRTPVLLQAWRCGLGLVPGALLGLLVLVLAAVVVGIPPLRSACPALVVGLLAAVAGYLLGTMMLNRALGIDYRRMR